MTNVVPTDIMNIANELKQWTIGVGQSGLVLPMASFNENSDRVYNLKNSKAGFCAWVDVSVGFNIGFPDNADGANKKKIRRWFFAGGEPIRYGETIAVGLGTPPSFLHNEHRTVGPDLKYVDSPQHEWRILGGRAGDPVRTGDLVALYNEKLGEPLIYFKRPVGANVGWPSSEGWLEQTFGRVWEEVKDGVRSVLTEGSSDAE